MSRIFIALVLSMAGVLCYDAIYDEIDVDKIIGDDELFNSYVDCLLDKGPCTVEHSNEFKQLLPEVINTACEKCTPKQRQSVRKSVKAIQEKKPAAFLEMQQKYDPKGEHIAPFAAFLMGSD